MKPLTKTGLLAVMLLSSSCSTGGPSLNDFCAHAQPIYMDAKDSVTVETARQILMHNDEGHVLCGWPYAS